MPDMESQTETKNKTDKRILLHIKELPDWFNLENYRSANQLDLEGWINQVYLRQIIQGFLLQFVLAGVVDDCHIPKDSSDVSSEVVQPISMHGAILITEAIKSIINVPIDIWQAPSHFDFFNTNEEHFESKSILSWSYTQEKTSVPHRKSALISHTNYPILRRFIDVDLSAPDSILFVSFKRWLAKERKLASQRRIRIFQKLHCNVGLRTQVLPFIDLTYWAKLAEVISPLGLWVKYYFLDITKALKRIEYVKQQRKQQES